MKCPTLPSLTSLLLIAAGGCVSVDSSDVKSSALFADFSVTAEGTGTALAKAALKLGGGSSNTFVNLTAGDTLQASAGATTMAMVRRELGGAIWYEATLPEVAEPYTLALARADDKSAPDSRTTLPAPYSITAPAASAVVSRAARFTATWSPSGTGDRMRWTLVGECIVPAAADISGDPGTLTIEANKILPLDPKAGATCPVTFELVRTRPGKVSDAYGKGGQFPAHQRRTVMLRSSP